jgi:hypothetical protein
MNPRLITAFFSSLAGIVTVIACTGCVSSKYKLAKTDTPPPVPLNLAVTQPPAEVVVHTVIAYQGPGSWKREAFWDEYVLTIARRGDTPLIIESAELLDWEQAAAKPGDDPWVLDREGRSWWKNVRSSPTTSLVALGAGTLLAGAVATSGLATLNVTVGLTGSARVPA